MIYSTVSALLGTMVVLLFVCEGRGLLYGNNVKERLMIFIEQDLITKGYKSDFNHVYVN
jgi:hypothetical protein